MSIYIDVELDMEHEPGSTPELITLTKPKRKKHLKILNKEVNEHLDELPEVDEVKKNKSGSFHGRVVNHKEHSSPRKEEHSIVTRSPRSKSFSHESSPDLHHHHSSHRTNSPLKSSKAASKKKVNSYEEDSKMINIKVQFDDRSTSVYVEERTTVEELIDLLANKLQISNESKNSCCLLLNGKELPSIVPVYAAVQSKPNSILSFVRHASLTKSNSFKARAKAKLGRRKSSSVTYEPLNAPISAVSTNSPRNVNESQTTSNHLEPKAKRSLDYLVSSNSKNSQLKQLQKSLSIEKEKNRILRSKLHQYQRLTRDAYIHLAKLCPNENIVDQELLTTIKQDLKTTRKEQKQAGDVVGNEEWNEEQERTSEMKIGSKKTNQNKEKQLDNIDNDNDDDGSGSYQYFTESESSEEI